MNGIPRPLSRQRKPQYTVTEILGQPKTAPTIPRSAENVAAMLLRDTAQRFDRSIRFKKSGAPTVTLTRGTDSLVGS